MTISCKVGSKYGIIDTEDGKTEFYTPAQISNFVNKGINVIMIFLIILKMVKLLMMN